MKRKKLLMIGCLALSLTFACSKGPDTPLQVKEKPTELTCVKINETDAMGQTMLHKAVLDRDMERLKILLSKGADLNVRDNSQQSPLHLALSEKNPEALKILINHGADITLPMPNGDSPLKFAVMGDDLEAAESLHLCPCNQDLLLTKDSPLRQLAILAVKNKRYSMAELFIRPLHYIIKRNKPEYLAQLLTFEKRLLAQTDEKKMTPLHIANFYRNESFIHLLKEAGADETSLDQYGKRPVDYGTGNWQTMPDINTLDDKTVIRIEDKMMDFLMYHDWMSIGIIKDGQIAYLKSYGPRNMLDRDAVHASVSKPMTSIIFLQLLKKGLIRSLDDDIGLYSKKYSTVMPAAYTRDKLSFRHILTHTSGIPHLGQPLWRKGQINLLFKPGTRFEYSSNAFSILGEIMTEVSGTSFSDLVKQYVGSPVGAKTFWAENEFRAPAARIHSTPRDFLKFAAGIIDHRYMSEKEFDDLLVGKTSQDSLGWGTKNIGSTDLLLAHSGANGRPRSHLIIKPRKKIALVLMGNTKTRDSDIWFMHLAPILLDIIEGKGGY